MRKKNLIYNWSNTDSRISLFLFIFYSFILPKMKRSMSIQKGGKFSYLFCLLSYYFLSLSFVFLWVSVLGFEQWYLCCCVGVDKKKTKLYYLLIICPFIYAITYKILTRADLLIFLNLFSFTQIWKKTLLLLNF